MSLPRLVMFVEGKGDSAAVPQVAKRIVAGNTGFDVLWLDPEPFVIKNLGNLVKNNCQNWHRWLSAAMKDRRPLAGVLLVLDGDITKVPRTWKSYFDRFGDEFCAYRAAAILADEARSARAGEAFSVSIVFAMKEFESWILAGIEGTRGTSLTGDRGRVNVSAAYPEKDVESLRDAKKVLRQLLPEYSPSLDQAVLASRLDIQLACQRNRSFRRMSSAIDNLIGAARARKPVVTPQIE